MSDFKIIETQEQLDTIIKERLQRERDTILKGYADYDDIKKRNGELEKSLGDANKLAEDQKITIADLEKTSEGYKTDLAKTRIALKHGLPLEMAGRLTGADEAELEKDAESLSGFVTDRQTAPPLASTEPAVEDEKTAAYKKMLGELKGE